MKKLIVFFNLAFPKAGTKFQSIPLYFSILYFFAFPVLFLRMLTNKNGTLACYWLFMIISIFFSIVFQTVYLERDVVLINFAQYLIPLFSTLCFYWIKSNKEAKSYDTIFIISASIIGSFGIFQKIFGDYTFLIPGLTVNYHDTFSPDFLSQKCNQIWSTGYLKLTSTYQNGNLFGVNFIMIFWVYFFHIKNRSIILKAVSFTSYIIICILTASSTVYFGMCVSIFIYMFFYIDFDSFFKKKNKLNLIFIAIVLALFVIFVIFYDNFFVNLIKERMLNRNISELGGRTKKILWFLENLNENPVNLFVGNIKPLFSTGEVTPLSIIQTFGIFTFVFFALFLYVIVKPIVKSPISIGIISYIFASFVDGCFWLPPTSFNLFFIIGYINKRLNNKDLHVPI